MAHKFGIGQTVELTPRLLRAAADGPYVIRHLLPAPENDPGDPCYRIKSADEKHERIVLESELSIQDRAPA